MLEQVKTDRMISTTLNTGSKILVCHAFAADGADAWGCRITTTEDDMVEFCLSEETFLTFVEGVLKLKEDPELGV